MFEMSGRRTHTRSSHKTVEQKRAKSARVLSYLCGPLTLQSVTGATEIASETMPESASRTLAARYPPNDQPQMPTRAREIYFFSAAH